MLPLLAYGHDADPAVCYGAGICERQEVLTGAYRIKEDELQRDVVLYTTKSKKNLISGFFQYPHEENTLSLSSWKYEKMQRGHKEIEDCQSAIGKLIKHYRRTPLNVLVVYVVLGERA